MTIRLAALVLVAACTSPDLLAGATPPVPSDIRTDCALASRRCSQCHALDRIMAREPADADDWRPIVHRMRFMPGSLIDHAEEAPIVRCLVYRNFGERAARAEAP